MPAGNLDKFAEMLAGHIAQRKDTFRFRHGNVKCDLGGFFTPTCGEMEVMAGYCFSGKPFHVWIDEASGTSRHRRTIRDLDFNEIKLTTGWPRLDKNITPPSNFNEMIEIARRLSEPFRFVRVDLYNIKNKIYFGELTFTPQSGVARWSDESYNKLYGSMLDISNLG